MDILKKSNKVIKEYAISQCCKYIFKEIRKFNKYKKDLIYSTKSKNLNDEKLALLNNIKSIINDLEVI